MKRRSFLKSVLGFLGLMFVPKAKPEEVHKKKTFNFDHFEQLKDLPNNPKVKIRWRRYYPLGASAMPLSDDIDSYGEFTHINDRDFMEGDQWTDEKLIMRGYFNGRSLKKRNSFG